MGDHESSNYGGLTPAATEKVVVEEVLLPGFRFHPTDEELVAFYLKRKIQQRPLSIELIRQLDIYKYDPWDLPTELATTGEKELYFYCPRDRKYRNSARPNRVTRAGFWKATGTDRPIYSSQGSSSKCIGLKKSLVFYKGRAAKGIKTDWMMHEFRLPTLADSANKRFLEKNHISANESWAICRIFKKTNPTAQRALSHSWVVSPFTEDTISHHDTPTQSQRPHHHYQYHPQMGSSETTMQFCGNGGDKDLKQQSTTCNNTFCSLDCSPCKPSNHHLPISAIGDLFSPFFGVSGSGSAKAGTGAAAADVPSLLSNMSSPLGLLGEFGKAFHGTGTVSVDDVALLQEMQDQNMRNQLISTNANANGLWGTLPFISGFPWSLPLNDTAADYSAWKSSAVWDHESSTQ